MTQLESIEQKISSLDALKLLCDAYKEKGKKIVFTNGCFDIVHRGHVEYLSKARDLGDVLVLGLNTDDSVKRIKGPGRPLQDNHTRSLVLASMQFIDHIVLFEQDTPYELIKTLVPDILVKGADYKVSDIVGSDIVLANGGKVIPIELTPGHSSTNIINKLLHN